MKAIYLGFAILASVVLAQVEVQAPVVTWHKVSIERLRSMGLPGIPPQAQDHVLVVVDTKNEAANMALVCVTFEEKGAVSEGCTYANFNETRKAAATVTTGFLRIDDAEVRRITVVDGTFQAIGNAVVEAQ